MTVPTISDLVERATAAPEVTPPPKDKPWEFDGLAYYERVIATVGDHREIGWGTMIYACAGERGRPAMPAPPAELYDDPRAKELGWTMPELDENGMIPAVPARDACGWEHRIWLGVGVEGPEALKDFGATIPAPFGCGTCPVCGAALLHARWNEDQEWDELRPIPAGAPRFVVPTLEDARRLAERNYGGADYIDPAGLTQKPKPTPGALIDPTGEELARGAAVIAATIHEALHPEAPWAGLPEHRKGQLAGFMARLIADGVIAPGPAVLGGVGDA